MKPLCKIPEIKHKRLMPFFEGQRNGLLMANTGFQSFQFCLSRSQVKTDFQHYKADPTALDSSCRLHSPLTAKDYYCRARALARAVRKWEKSVTRYFGCEYSSHCQLNFVPWEFLHPLWLLLKRHEPNPCPAIELLHLAHELFYLPSRIAVDV